MKGEIDAVGTGAQMYESASISTASPAEHTEKTILLHVGLHKTGTTSIQSALQGYDDGETAYAELEDPNHSVLFQTLFSEDQNHEYWSRMGLSDSARQELIAGYWSALEREFARPRSRIIFSGEGISLLTEEALSRLGAFLQERCGKVAVFFFVREPLSWTISGIQQHIKAGRKLDDESCFYSDASSKLKRFLQVFGRENVRILYFEDALSQEGSRGVVDYFSNIANLDRQRLQVDLRVNEALDETTFKLLKKFFDLNLLYNQGEMLERVRWSFVSTLDDVIVQNRKRRRIDPEFFEDKVDWDDAEELNKLIDRKYEIRRRSDSEKKLTSYWDDIDHQSASALLTAYLKNQGVPLSEGMDIGDLLVMLFYHVMRLDACQTSLDALEVIRTELQQKDCELHQKNMELGQKEADLLQKDMTLRQIGDEIRQRDEELRKKEGERLQMDVALRQLGDEIRHRSEELQQKRDELQQKHDELQQKQDELRQKQDELRQKRDELQQKHDELQQKQDELRQMSKELQLTKQELLLKDAELSNVKSRLAYRLLRPFLR